MLSHGMDFAFFYCHKGKYNYSIWVIIKFTPSVIPINEILNFEVIYDRRDQTHYA